MILLLIPKTFLNLTDIMIDKKQQGKSFDERISAQFSTLAALKTHTKGLIQQLFPAVEVEA